MNIHAQKRIAAEILQCGINRVYIEPGFVDEVEMAISREDIRALIKQQIIKKKQIKGIAKSRVKERHERKKRGLARGYGKRKGTRNARTPHKRKWINTIRPQRRKLRELRDEGKIDRRTYRKMYLRSKGGTFKSTAAMVRFMNENKMIKK